MKYMQFLFGLILAFGAYADGAVTIKSVTAQQRFPWNGLVDIVVTMEGSADDIAITKCTFVATNSATDAAVPITSVVQNGADTGSDTSWTRWLVWDAANDVGTVKIHDLSLTVDVAPIGVQLWENGPRWAECNVGATKPEEYGCYFWWGDTIGYKRNAANNGWISVRDDAAFSFSSGNCPTYGKNNSQLQSAGYIDSTGNLIAAHDAATAHLGVPWRMPTDAEFSALINNCDSIWTSREGVFGRLVTGRGAYSSKNIFLPAAGEGGGSNLYSEFIGTDSDGKFGDYWSSTPDSDYSSNARNLGLNSGDFDRVISNRSSGLSVRPVRGFFNVDSATLNVGVTVKLKIDCRTGVRVPSTDGESLRYDANWCEGGDEVRIKENGAVIATGTAGVHMWRIGQSNSCRTLTLEVLSKGEIVRSETAQFGFGYIRNVTARQLWPHNKVALEFTVAADIGEVKSANENLLVWCAHGVLTNVATQVVGDCLATPGIHRVIWDFDAEGLRLANKETMFGVSLEEIHTSNGGVQLWENGPYWAECNVGATKPEEYGYYFWWGDVVGYKRNAGNNGWISAKDDSTFSFSSGNCPTHGKNNSKLQSEGYIDSAGNLVAAYDAATVYLGAPWRMPTNAEIDALISNCTTAWITTNGVYGRLVTGKGAYASKSIFLPAAGYGGNSDLRFVGSRGYSWSSTIGSGSPGEFYFNSSAFQRSSSEYRYFGCSVRPLRGFAK